MRPEFDAVDAQILAERETAFNQNQGPRVGDFLRVEGGFLRFTHDWGDSIQTTVHAKHPCHGDASFYLSDGYASFSGSLDPAISKDRLKDTGELQQGSFWFFHHNHACAENGVYFKIACRVFEIALTIEEELKELGFGHRRTANSANTDKHEVFRLSDGQIIGTYRALEAVEAARRLVEVTQ